MKEKYEDPSGRHVDIEEAGIMKDSYELPVIPVTH